MDAAEHLRQAIESLADHPRRVVASSLGVFWGAAAIVVLLAWGAGFRAFARAELSRFGSACVLVLPGVTSSGFVGHREGVHVSLSRSAAAEAERSASDMVEAIVPEHLSATRVLAEANGRVERLDLTGSDHRFAAYRNFRVASGRMLEPADVALRRTVAILGHDAAATLFVDAEAAVGKTLRIDGRPFEVIGVAAKKGRQYINTHRPDNRLVIVPVTTAESVLGYDEEAVSRLDVYPRPGVPPRQALNAVLARLGPRSQFDPADLDAVRWFDISAPARIAELFSVGFMIFVGVAGTVTLLVGAVGVANYQLATLAERTVEIAVAKAIGARSRTLMIHTVIEAILIAGGSASLGVGLGLAACRALATLAPSDAFPRPIVTPLGTGVTLFAVAGVAVVASVIPALRVRRMEIAVALRAAI